MYLPAFLLRHLIFPTITWVAQYVLTQGTMVNSKI